MRGEWNQCVIHWPHWFNPPLCLASWLAWTIDSGVVRWGEFVSCHNILISQISRRNCIFYVTDNINQSRQCGGHWWHGVIQWWSTFMMWQPTEIWQPLVTWWPVVAWCPSVMAPFRNVTPFHDLARFCDTARFCDAAQFCDAARFGEGFWWCGG